MLKKKRHLKQECNIVRVALGVQRSKLFHFPVYCSQQPVASPLNTPFRQIPGAPFLCCFVNMVSSPLSLSYPSYFGLSWSRSVPLAGWRGNLKQVGARPKDRLVDIGIDGRGESKYAGQTTVCGKWSGALAQRLENSEYDLHCTKASGYYYGRHKQQSYVEDKCSFSN